MQPIESATVSVLHSQASHLPWWGWLILGWLGFNLAFVLARHLVTLPAKTKAKADRQVVLDVWDGRRV